MGIVLKTIIIISRVDVLKTICNLQQHKQHDSTIIPLGNNTPQRQGLFFKTIIVNSMSM